jgi:phosphopantothenoylcysteine decarboxylase/phosphopantothenate--cysteine ligase
MDNSEDNCTYDDNKNKNENNNNINKPGNFHIRDIYCALSRDLLGKKIVICITGSVAAYKAIDLTRLLIRHGAEVFPVMSEASVISGRVITKDIMQWASGNNVVTKLTANLEHIFLADYNMSDLVLVYPCTANTIGKMANGIDDTPVTSVLAVASGSKIPITIAPAMHKSMYFNTFINANIQKLKKSGVQIISPLISENKAKLAEPEEVFRAILERLSKNGGSAPDLAQELKQERKDDEEVYIDNNNKDESLSGRNILVTAGSTVEFIDPIRVISNLSSGKMGNAIAQEAHKKGANVTLIYGHGSCEPRELPRMNIVKVSTNEEMYHAIISEIGTKIYDAAFMSAAIADYKPTTSLPKKINTRKRDPLTLSLSPTRKIVNEVKSNSKNSGIFLVAFKADYNRTNEEMTRYALKKMSECSCDLVVANDVGRKGCEPGSETNEVIVINKKKNIMNFPLQKKKFIARKLLDLMASGLQA